QSPTPVRVAGLSATAVTAGGFHTCALPGDGTVRCWGQNDLGQLGNGTSDPVPNNPSTFNPTPVTVSGITTAVAISAGGWYTCALLQDGTVRCWGDNTWGELGNGAVLVSPSPTSPVTPTPTPATVSGITTAVRPSHRNHHRHRRLIGRRAHLRTPSGRLPALLGAECRRPDRQRDDHGCIHSSGGHRVRRRDLDEQ